MTEWFVEVSKIHNPTRAGGRPSSAITTRFARELRLAAAVRNTNFVMKVDGVVNYSTLSRHRVIHGRRRSPRYGFSAFMACLQTAIPQSRQTRNRSPASRKLVDHLSTSSSFSTRSTISRRSSTTASNSVIASLARSCGSGSSSLSSSDSSFSQVISSLYSRSLIWLMSKRRKRFGFRSVCCDRWDLRRMPFRTPRNVAEKVGDLSW